MDAISPDITVGDIVTRHPGALPVFERLGIDYCCGGGRRLDEAASASGVGWQEVAAQIEAALAAAADSPAQPSWADAPLTDSDGPHRRPLPRHTARADADAVADG